MQQVHELKVATEYFNALASGDKNFEVRRDDRGFQKGDTLVLRRYGREWVNNRITYLRDEDTGVSKSEADTIRRTITYVLTGGQFGIEPGYVVLGLSEETP